MDLCRPRNDPGPEMIPNWTRGKFRNGMASIGSWIHSETILVYDVEFKGFLNRAVAQSALCLTVPLNTNNNQHASLRTQTDFPPVALRRRKIRRHKLQQAENPSVSARTHASQITRFFSCVRITYASCSLLASFPCLASQAELTNNV